MRRRLLATVLALAALGSAAACTSGTDGRGSAAPTSSAPRSVSASASASASSSSSASSTPASSAASSPSTSASEPPELDRARAVFDAMTPAERVGQLFMVDCPTTSVGEATVAAIRDHHVGSVILDGTSQAGLTATRQVTARLQQLAPAGIRLFVSTDQEGGLVQRLQGPGFSAIPSGVEQGTMTPAALRSAAAGWARELRAAGVNVNLAPVLDVVPAGFGPNPPIGDLDRQYGSTPATVTSHGLAFARGMLDGGIAPTVKHFPGLGRTRGNTDTTSGVLDEVTTATDPYLAPFAGAARAGVPFVMVGTAIYTRIDPSVPAIFSRKIVTGLLRGRLGYRGIVVTDDVGNAAQVSGYSVGQRAVSFIAAGGTMVLTVDATQTGAMTAAVLARAAKDPAFRTQVDAAALLVLRTKAARGLLR